MTVRETVEQSLPTILGAGVIAFGTMTYQFAQMRVEMEALRRDTTRIESMVSAILARQAYYNGSTELDEVARIADAIQKTRQPSAPGGLVSAAQAAEEK